MILIQVWIQIKKTNSRKSTKVIMHYTIFHPSFPPPFSPVPTHTLSATKNQRSSFSGPGTVRFSANHIFP